MVGSSANAICEGEGLGVVSTRGGVGVLSATGGGGGGGGGGGATATAVGVLVTVGGGGGGGGDTAVTGGSCGGAGRLPDAPGMKEKSSASEEESQGTCSPREARVTPTRVRFSVSSAIRSGTRISLSNSCTNWL